MTKFLKALLVAAIVATGVVAVQSPASAYGENCTGSTKFCFYEGDMWNGPMYYWTLPTSGGGFCTNIGGSWNDNGNSAKLKVGSYVILYRGSGCGGGTVATAVNGSEQDKLINCKETYNDWNRSATTGSPCLGLFGENNSTVSSFWYVP